MGINSEQDEFIINLRKITNFFRYTLESGLLFCVCTNQVFVKQINEQIKARTSGLGLNVRELYISPDDIDIFIPIIRQAANENPDGIIINNLDELILVSKGSFLEGINLAREILLDLDIPMLFWLSERNVSLFANKAHDLFRRRDRGVVYFSDLSGSSGMDRFKESYSREYMSSEDYNSLNLKIGLLEKQLGEAEAKQYKEKRIATEIVADLIKLYLKVFLRHEAYALFEKYGKYFEDDNIKYVDLKADLYYDICMWDKALEFYLKSEKISLEVGDKAGLSQTYNNIGLIYDNKGDWDRALEFYLKSEKIVIEVGDKAGLGPIYNNIGLIYRKKSDWDRALEFYLKSEKIVIEVGDKAGLGTTYNNIGAICDKKGDWDRALEFYLKSEKIRIEVGDKAGLGTTYNNIGGIYDKKGDWDRALEFYLKSEKISLEVGDKAGLAYTYFNIGTTYQEKKNNKKAENYLILAGYIAKTLGMKHEFSEMQWALEPVMKKMGEKKFMKAGKKLFDRLKLSTV